MSAVVGKNKVQLVKLLNDFNENFITNEKQFTEKTEEFHKIPLKEVTDYFQSTLKVLHFLNTIEDSKDFQYIAIQLYILSLLNNELEKGEDEILSVQESKKIKSYIQYVMVVGVYSKLSPTLPFYQNKKIFDNNFSNGAFSVYNILKFSVFLLGHLLKCQNLRLLILPDSLKGILVGIYQIGFCQLKKPSTQKTSTEFVITDEIYSKLLEEKQIFRNLLDNLRCTIHPAIFVRETMVIFQSDSPLWFKKSVSQTLTHILRMNNGVENIVGALLDGVNDDSAKTWQILEVISKLLVSCRKFPDFRENTCRQLLKLLDKIDEHSLVYERIFISFTKTLYAVDRELSKSCLIGKVINEFLYFTYKSHTFNDGDKTENIVQNIRLLHALFIDQSNADIPALPLTLLKSTINVIYRLYSVTVKTAFNKTTKQELTTLLISFLTHHPDEVFKLFDSFLFNINASDILEFRNDVLLTVDHNSIHLHCPAGHTVTYSTSENADTLLLLFKNQPDLRTTFFSYLLKCLTEKEKYFKKNTNHDLMLNVEDEFMNEYIERNLAVYKLLSELAEDKTVQKMLVDKPDNIINYIQDVLLKTVETNLHKTEEIESDGFQTVFTVIMILQSLVTNCDKNCLVKYKILIEPIQKICMECTNKELQELMKEILKVLDDNGEQTRRFVVENVKSDLDKAIDDICDPLLPVQGHGLMTLTKLIEKKDKQVLERKQYVLNIFQQNIKNEDSYIYLTAISGLAALADLFPDTVLNTLCEEYVDFSRKNNDDGHEIRMKIGEVLVRTTKTLGDLAPKYKPLLLNTFLNVTKDDDDLMRTSSLSNLGEVCKILGYRLGTIVTEVLVCVHAIIATDKSVEARRAAVTVIRQLFVGLDSEMIAFLKDDILPIYRTLKQIYGNDKDDIMRLQAQLALEELNENMKKFVFPNPQLHMEKKIVMLD